MYLTVLYDIVKLYGSPSLFFAVARKQWIFQGIDLLFMTCVFQAAFG